MRITDKKDGARPVAVRIDDSNAGFDQYHQEAFKPRPVTLSDVFNLLDTDQSGVLSLDEFRQLFEALGDKLSPGEIDELFACCDLDGSQMVTQEELEDGWDCVMKNVVRKEMDELGASMTDIIIAIFITICLLIALFAFIFLALQGWTGETSLEAVVQSALIAGSGKLSTALRNRTPAEGNDIDQLIQEMGDADGEDGDDGE